MALMRECCTPHRWEAFAEDRNGVEFDRLFWWDDSHHKAAFDMGKIYSTPRGWPGPPVVQNFANDADNTQRAEIRIMESILTKET